MCEFKVVSIGYIIFWIFLNRKKKKRERNRQPRYFSQKEQEAWRRKSVTSYFSTRPRYQVNKIPGEARKTEATTAPPWWEPLFRAQLLMKANYCSFPEGNTESFMKWSKISKLAYTIFFPPPLLPVPNADSEKPTSSWRNWTDSWCLEECSAGWQAQRCPHCRPGPEGRGCLSLPGGKGQWLINSDTATLWPYPWPAARFHVGQQKGVGSQIGRRVFRRRCTFRARARIWPEMGYRWGCVWRGNTTFLIRLSRALKYLWRGHIYPSPEAASTCLGQE